VERESFDSGVVRFVEFSFEDTVTLGVTAGSKSIAFQDKDTSSVVSNHSPKGLDLNYTSLYWGCVSKHDLNTIPLECTSNYRQWWRLNSCFIIYGVAVATYLVCKAGLLSNAKPN